MIFPQMTILCTFISLYTKVLLILFPYCGKNCALNMYCKLKKNSGNKSTIHRNNKGSLRVNLRVRANAQKIANESEECLEFERALDNL